MEDPPKFLNKMIFAMSFIQHVHQEHGPCFYKIETSYQSSSFISVCTLLSCMKISDNAMRSPLETLLSSMEVESCNEHREPADCFFSVNSHVRSRSTL